MFLEETRHIRIWDELHGHGDSATR
jgi:hypothetical protein